MPASPDVREPRGGSLVLRRRQVVGLWALAVVFALACVALGRWQWHRFEDKRARSDLVQRNYGAPAVPLSDLLAGPQAPFDRGDQWRRVEVTGTYDTSSTQLVRNRPWDGGSSTPTFGYEVLVPLRLANGAGVLVDRGWQSSATAPAPPSGQVQVVVRLRPSEASRREQLPPGQVGSIAVPAISRVVGYPLYAAYGGLVSESPAPSTAPSALDPPDLDGNEGVNASYAVQWVVFALLGLGFPVWVVRQRRAAALEEAEPATGVVPVATRRRPRIWDTDDEDAMTD